MLVTQPSPTSQAVADTGPVALRPKYVRGCRRLHPRRARRGLTLGELLAILLLLSLLAITIWVGPSYAPRLPDVNAALNITATVLLIAGYIQIKRGNEKAHKSLMLAAFGTSILFLASYLVYHAHAGSRSFGGTGTIRTVYLAILISHSILAAVVPLLAIYTIWLGLKDRRQRHRRWARWTLPIWLYVSVTGVVVYSMLYHWYPPPEVEPPPEQSVSVPGSPGSEELAMTVDSPGTERA